MYIITKIVWDIEIAKICIYLASNTIRHMKTIKICMLLVPKSTWTVTNSKNCIHLAPNQLKTQEIMKKKTAYRPLPNQLGAKRALKFCTCYSKPKDSCHLTNIKSNYNLGANMSPIHRVSTPFLDFFSFKHCVEEI
ncbi:hypothetical protein KFK09_023798 [Dendrobium nobile]|uniref:Uncharacterized protein n=1 Tax=Dendrobium nobile TaxID=94219 RepID=A0A8T3AB82_DENNO|nr:hypothetical protein KFK09_023798 [Dendrobium nobile]